MAYTFGSFNIETEYKIGIENVTGHLDFPQRKRPTEFEFADEQGAKAFSDEDDITWEPRDIILHCHMDDTTEANFRLRMNKMINDMSAVGMHSLVLEHALNTYRVYLRTDSPMDRLTKWNGTRNVGQFKLVFREPRPSHPSIWKSLESHYVMNSANEVLGTEMITATADRDFSAASGWADVDMGGGYDETGDLTVSSTGAGQYCKLPDANISAFTTNKTYKLTVTASSLSGDTFHLEFGTTDQNLGTLANGSNTFYFGFNVGGTDLEVVADGTGAITLDNFSIKPVTCDDEADTSDGALYNFDVSPYTTDREGNSNGAIDFDGVDDYIDTGATFQTTFRDSFSISFWCKPDDGNPGANLHFCGSNDNDTDVLYVFLYINGKLYVSYEPGGILAQAITADAVFENGAADWTHLAFVIDKVMGISIYANGVKQTLDSTGNGSMTSVTMADFTTTKNLYVGARNNDGTVASWTAGPMHSFRVHSKALSYEEVKVLYHTQVAGTLDI